MELARTCGTAQGRIAAASTGGLRFAANPHAFHAADGRGYQFLSRMILAVDAINPQTAAKLVPPLGRWKRYDEARGTAMRGELVRIGETPGLSKDVFEQASKSLAG